MYSLYELEWKYESQLSFRETSKTPNRHGLSSSNLKM